MQLTKRDFEIINFILDMKFVSAQNIHQKFFRNKKDGSISTSEWYARERLRELTLDGYIQPVRYRFENKSYYIGTKNGFDLIKYCGNVSFNPVKPIPRIDVRTFDHDIKVMESRILLEESEKVSNWESDRQLRSRHFEYFLGCGSRDSAPDGVYKSFAGKTIAFEYEIAQKSRKRYRAKISAYVHCIRQNNFLDSPKYDHVRIVCEKENVHKILLEETALYKSYFTIERSDQFFSSDKELVYSVSAGQIGADNIQ